MASKPASNAAHDDALAEMISSYRRGRGAAGSQWFRRREDLLLGVSMIVFLLLIWEMAAALSFMDPKYISSPSRILQAARPLATSGELWHHVQVSAKEYLLGYAIALLTGIPLGLALGWSQLVGTVLSPFLSGLYAMPLVALVPIIVKWAGIGYWSKVIIVYLMVVFPLAVNAEVGVRSANHTLLKAARAFGASQWNTFRTVVIPGSVPYLLTGMRLAAGRGLIGIVVGELYASTAGIGFLIQTAGSTFKTDVVFVGIALLAGAGVLLFQLLERFERRFDSWRPVPIRGE